MAVFVVLETQSEWCYNGECSVEVDADIPIRAFATEEEAKMYIASQDSTLMTVIEIPFGDEPLREQESGHGPR